MQDTNRDLEVYALKELSDYASNLEKPLRFKIKTFGCQMNERDSEAIRAMLDSAGFEEVSKGDADLYIFNTCCVRDRAERKAVGNIAALKEYKRSHPKALICVCGCMMQQPSAADELKRRFPFVDVVFGTGNLDKLPALLIEAVNGRKRLAVETPNTVVEGLPRSQKVKVSAFVNIMYGCDNFCSYCVVPLVRGRERSRLKADILAEIRGLVDNGTREVVLLGQNVNSYGKPDGETFAELLHSVAAVEGLLRIRFMTSHPKDLSDELIDMIAYEPKVCTQLHLPMQSGSDSILAAMNRGYTIERYKERINRLRERAPHVGLSTDIIVGFPGESDDDYERTLDAVRELNFVNAYMFAYSKRKNTKASLMDGQLDEMVKNERLIKLIALQDEIAERHHLKLVGRTVSVLAEGVARRGGAISGKTDDGITVVFEGDPGEMGNIVDVRIDSVRGHVLEGVRL